VAGMLLALLLACHSPKSGPDDTSGGTPDDSGTAPDDSGSTDSGTTDDTGTTANPEAICDTLGLTAREWDASGTDGEFDTVAPDFTVTTLDGDWSWSAAFSGCESVVSVEYSAASAYPNLEDLGDVRHWIEDSPPNVHYLIYSSEMRIDDRTATLEAVKDKVDNALGRLDDPDLAAWWAGHIHYVTDRVGAGDTFPGSLQDEYGSASFPVNWAIDRFQHVREVGSLSDPVTGFSTAPPSFLADSVRYFNAESDREDRLDAEHATVIRAFETSDQRATTVELPDADTMATFDTLELDMSFICNGHPDTTGCGEWDYLAYVYLCDNDDPSTPDTDESGTCVEMGRFITAYARPGRWVVDATPFLAMLNDGGPHVIRVDSANAPFITLDLRLSNQGKGVRPVAMEYLWGGGGFNETYNDGRDPIAFTPPEGTTRVDVMGLITGHGYGKDRANCAEFCNHQHEFTVNGAGPWMKEEPEAGSNYGCEDQIEDGTVPNQYGTWVLGRGGWCPGKQVDPWSADITSAVDLTGENAIAYRGLYEGDTYVPVPYDSGEGFGAVIVANTWLVYYR
jgi:hypothetical protein